MLSIKSKGQEGETKIQKSISMEIKQELSLEQENDTGIFDHWI